MKISDRVHSIELFHNRSYLIVDKRLTLIDTGFPGRANKILKYIKKIGRNESELELIILTHHHIDHRGSARKLKQLTHTKIAAHKEDVPYIEGRKFSSEDALTIESKITFLMADIFFRKENVEVDIELEDGDVISDLEIIHTPGHTKGSICLYDKAEKLIFTGDITMPQLGKMLRRNRYSYDWQKHLSSLMRIKEIDFKGFLPTDGKMFINHSYRLK